MHLIEHIMLVGDSVMVYEYATNDAATFAKPFTAIIPLRVTDDQIFEYACHEGNYAMAGMLKGARQLEKEAAMANLE